MGRKVPKYGYEILDLWRLKQPASLDLAIAKGFLKGPPQKYCWLPQVCLRSYPLHKQVHLISNAPAECSAEKGKQIEVDKPEMASNSTEPRKISKFSTSAN